MGVEQPAVVEAGGLGLAGQRQGAFDRVIGLEREAELHVRWAPWGEERTGSAVLLQTVEPDGMVALPRVG